MNNKVFNNIRKLKRINIITTFFLLELKIKFSIGRSRIIFQLKFFKNY